MPDVVTRQFNDLPAWVKGLVTLGSKNIPFLRVAGFDNGGAIATSMTFEMGQVEAAPTGAQLSLTEDGVIAGAEITTITRAAESNYAQLFQERVSVSYLRQSLSSGLTGLDGNNGATEIDPVTHQINAHLRKMYADCNFAALLGTKAAAANSAQAWQTGGIIPQVIAGGNYVNGAGGALSKTLVDSLFLEAADGGAEFLNPILWVSATNKQRLSALYGVQPMDRMVGGVNITTIATDFGNVGVAYDRTITDDKILLADMAFVRPVFVPVKGGETILVEQLSQSGAAELWQIYAQFGIDYKAAKLHGVLGNFIQ
jgi:hypothetical protein